MFEIRNFVAHSFGTKVAEPNNDRIDEILERHPELTVESEGELMIRKGFLDQSCELLERAYVEIGQYVYPD